MCGIAGLFHLDGGRADPDRVAAMLAQIGHRGPDDSGVVAAGPAALGHARLSIIDLAGGHQPMSNEDGSLWVTFNGEIFNYVELREMLQAKRHRFATRSDTEVILHAYEQYGEECVRHFNGQWALAIWDSRRKSLFLSRDRLGVRPLFYTTAGSTLLFASEIKAIFSQTEVSREIDPVGLDQLFTYWATLPPRTVFRDIRELAPGHNLTLSDGSPKISRYWQLSYNIPETAPDEAQCAERLRELLIDATRLRLRSDVPVGAYLSGGLDSTVTAALARRCTQGVLRTFSITFDDAEFDESSYQQEAVRFLGTDHQTIHCTADDVAAVFPDVVWHAERPMLRTAPAPMYLLAQLVRSEGFKVVLTGEGADEMLGGYDIFKEAKIRRFWAVQPDSTFRARLFEKLYPYLPNFQAQPLPYRQAFFHVRPEDLAHPLFSHLPRWELTSRLKMLFSAQLRACLGERTAYADCLGDLPEAFGHWDPFCQAQYLETTILLPGYILCSQSDRMAMAHAVEGRFPFLDPRLAEWAATLPPCLKMKGLDEKHLLKRATADLVPPAVVKRAKQPYRAPDGACFFPADGRSSRHGYVDELLSPRRVAEDGIFHPQAVECLVRKFRQGKALGVKDNMALVGVLSTQLLVDRFVRSFTPEPVARSAPSVAWPPPWHSAAMEPPVLG